MKLYAIKHRESGKFFADFEPVSFAPKWGSVEQAITWADKEMANAQAILLRRFGSKVQLKPVVV